MINLDRYKKAKELRDSGLTFKEVGDHIGVGPYRARQMAGRYEAQIKADERRRASGEPALWWRGLKYPTFERLQIIGFKNSDDCKLLLADDFVVKRGRVIVVEPNFKHDGSITLKMLNEVRIWLGAPEFVPKLGFPTTAEIIKAKRLLQLAGYKIEYDEVKAR